jgi:hypothetical protein
MPPVFRWDITRPEQLGRLVALEAPVQPACLADPTPDFDVFVDAVRSCCARVIAAAGDSQLVFIGRSPESLFDYLSGAFAETSWANRIELLHVSFRSCDGHWRGFDPAARAAVAELFRSAGVDPLGIVSSHRPIALIDLICSGDTFERLTTLLATWAAADGIDERAMWRRIRIVGITRSHAPYSVPSSWKQQDWAARFRPNARRGISVPDWFWTYLGDDQPKVSRSNPSWCWADPTMTQPPREPVRGAALRLASALHQRARRRGERDALIAAIAELPSVRHPWCRGLLAQLRSVTRPKRIERSFGSKWRVRSSRRNATRQ